MSFYIYETQYEKEDVEMTEANAEWLKCADEFLKDLSAEGDGIGLHGQTLELVGWLIEQAEQAQKLEKSVRKAIEMQEYHLVTNHNLHMENQRLREALEEITSWPLGEENARENYIIRIARRALEGVSNE